MNQQNSNGKFNGFLRFEAILKSALLGLATGGAAAFLFGLVAWFLEFDGFAAALILFVLTSCIAGLIYYWKLFYVTDQRNARRLDRYGLDERMVTMVELSQKEDVLAKLQREDALRALAQLDSKRVKLKLSKLVVTLAVVCGVLAVGMVTVEGLSTAGILPSGTDVWLSIFPPPPPESFDVEYLAGRGGVVHGQVDQSVYEGQDSENVLAVADEGFMFLMWNDGNTNPSRSDKNVRKDLSYTAVFVEISIDKSFGKDPGDKPDDVPSLQGDPSEYDNSEDGSGSRYMDINKIIDNEIYYRDVYADYYQAWIERLESGEEIPDDILKIIEGYFKIIN